AALKIDSNLTQADAHLSFALLHRQARETAWSASPAQLQSWAFNTAVLGDTPAQLPPQVFAYNPYPAVRVGPASPRTVAFSLTGEDCLPDIQTDDGKSSAFVATGGYPVAASVASYGGTYNPYYQVVSAGSPYYSATVTSTYGELTVIQEQARLLREQ